MARPLQFNCLLAPCLVLVSLFVVASAVYAGEAPEDWKKMLEAAKKEGKVVVGGPPTNVLRQKFKDTFEKRFGIELEILSAPGPQNASRAIAEFKAGVKYFDVLHGGSGTLEPLMRENMLAPFMDFVILRRSQRSAPMVGRPHVGRQHQDPSLHLLVLRGFLDSAVLQRGFGQGGRSQVVRRFFASQVEEQDRFFRTAHSQRRSGALGISDEDQGQGIFAEVGQSRIVHQPRRQTACRLDVQGKPRLQLGQSQRFIEPYLKAGIPIKPLNNIKEGLSGSNGFGTVAI